MPLYRINGMTVHMRGTRLPPACTAGVGVQTSDGAAMTICGAPSGFQCDWDIGLGRTCDRRVCRAHSHEVGKNKHYCPAHSQQHLDEQAQDGLFTSLVQS